VPYHADDYVHRVGRTGRAGRSGLALMLATGAETKYVDAIERLTGIKITRRKVEGIEVRGAAAEARQAGACAQESGND
jgi:superfamily II DNA/RNA helicase